jgi:hypothetical protein
MFKSFFGALVSFTPHFWWRDRRHFYKDHNVDGSLVELGICNACHCFYILIGFTSILIGGHWGEQFRFAPLLGALEIIYKKILLVTTTCLPSFEQLAKRGVNQFQEYFKKIAQSFLFQHHFKHVF